LELDEVLAAVVVVVVELDVVVVGCARVVVVAGDVVVVVVGAVVGGTVVVVVGAAVVVVTGAPVVVVVSWATALLDGRPSMIGVALTARISAAERQRTFECMAAAYGDWPTRMEDRAVITVVGPHAGTNRERP
jgi:hypothetical protein